MKIAFDKEIRCREDAVNVIKEIADVCHIHVVIPEVSKEQLIDIVKEAIHDDKNLYHGWTLERVIYDVEHRVNNKFFSKRDLVRVLERNGYSYDVITDVLYVPSEK